MAFTATPRSRFGRVDRIHAHGKRLPAVDVPPEACPLPRTGEEATASGVEASHDVVEIDATDDHQAPP